MGTTVAMGDLQEPTMHRERAIQQLTNIFSSRLPAFTRMAARLMGCAADAEDAVQDAFLSAYMHVDQFRGQAKMSTWLTRIVINAARMKVRARPRQVHISLEENREQDRYLLSEMLSDRRPSPEELCRSRELTQHLAQASTQLSAALRGALQLSQLDGLSVRQTAQAPGIPYSMAKARAFRARKKLKHLLQAQKNRCPDDKHETAANTIASRPERRLLAF